MDRLYEQGKTTAVFFYQSTECNVGILGEKCNLHFCLVANQAATYFFFLSILLPMKQQGVLLFPLDGILVHHQINTVPLFPPPPKHLVRFPGFVSVLVYIHTPGRSKRGGKVSRLRTQCSELARS